jgi:small subunit ribosomal protein S10e
MLIPKQNRKQIYQYLFQEGVLVAKKDYELPLHPEIKVSNLQVIKALQSLTSRGYVVTQFSWQYYYYSLTNEGIEYLRNYLHLPVEIVPRTFLKQAKGVSGASGFKGDGGREYKGEEKKQVGGGDWKPEFRGGVGRGKQ